MLDTSEGKHISLLSVHMFAVWGRVASSLSLYPGFCKDYQLSNPPWSRAQIITIAEADKGNVCRICIGSQQNEVMAFFGNLILAVKKQL